KRRGRDLGIQFSSVTGKSNSITDVEDVEVGFSTIIEGDSIQTDVTAVFPCELVGTYPDSLIKWALKKNNSNTMINIETYDGYFNDINGSHVKEEEYVFEALDDAKRSDSVIQEGNAGSETGMISLGFKVGTAISSRKVDCINYMIEILVQSNFGRKKQLIIAVIPAGEELLKIEKTNANIPDEDAR
ncbi:unnamed protein product, partial [Rotaria sordida]